MSDPILAPPPDYDPPSDAPFNPFTLGAGTVNQPTRPAAISRVIGPVRVNFATLSERVILPTTDLDVVTAQVEAITASPTVPTFTQKVSNDGYTWFALSGASTITSESISTSVTVTGYRFYALEITVVGVGYGVITLRGKASV